MKALDRVFGCLMVLAGIGHALGSYKVYSKDPMTLLWALSAWFAVIMLGALNLLRAGRKGDRAVAWISVAGCVVWIGFALQFGLLIGNVSDFRPMGNLVISLVLAVFSVRSALQSPLPA